MWWGGFSELQAADKRMEGCVLIPMWWGGFSEGQRRKYIFQSIRLNPHVVGRFFRELTLN